MDIAKQIDEALGARSLVVPQEWAGFPGRAFGGFVAAVALRVAERESSQPRPVSILGRFFRATPVGDPVEVEHTVEHAGRSFESHEVRFEAQGKTTARFTVQRAAARHDPYTSQRLTPPDQSVETKPIYEMLESFGAEPPAHMRHTEFEGIIDLASPDPGVDGRWPVQHGQAALAAILPIDNSVAPAMWRAHGQTGMNATGEPITLDLAAWFYDLDVEDGKLFSRTEVPAAVGGLGAGRTDVWSGDRLVASGMSAVMTLPRG